MGPTFTLSELPMDSIKLAANNGESNISIGWNVLLDGSNWYVWTKFSNWGDIL